MSYSLLYLVSGVISYFNKNFDLYHDSINVNSKSFMIWFNIVLIFAQSDVNIYNILINTNQPWIHRKKQQCHIIVIKNINAYIILGFVSTMWFLSNINIWCMMRNSLLLVWNTANCIPNEWNGLINYFERFVSMVDGIGCTDTPFLSLMTTRPNVIK